MLNFNIPLRVTRTTESGEIHSETKAIMWPGYIAVPVDADIETGDKVERRLPSGKSWVVYVSEVNVLENPFTSGQDHTEVKYTTAPPRERIELPSMGSLDFVNTSIFKRADLRYLAGALSSGLTQGQIDKFEAGLETDTRGEAKDSRAAVIVKHLFDGPDADDSLLNMLNHIYFEAPRGHLAVESNEYAQLKKILDLRGVRETEDGFQVGARSENELRASEASNAATDKSPHLAPASSPVSGGGVRLTESLVVGGISLGNGTQGTTDIEATGDEPANRKVFIVRGRDERPVQALETFLHFAGLEVMSWNDAEDLLDEATPDTYDVIKKAMNAAAAIVIVFSPDDEARLKEEFAGTTEDLEGQARQNVILEAGMAFGMARERTIFVQSSTTRPISDIAGFNWVTMDGTWTNREKLIGRLKRAGAQIKLVHSDLNSHLAGPFKVT